MLRDPNTITPTDVTINDPVLEPFFITKSTSGGYTVFEKVVAGKNGKPYLKIVGYYSQFNSCLKKIATEFLHYSSSGQYDTVAEFLTTYSSIENKLSAIANID